MAYQKYTVKKGDCLSTIAAKFKTTVYDIKKANPDKIKNVNVIQVGWVLKIPVPNTSKPDTPTTKPATPTAKPTKDYAAIGKQYETALRDVQNLPSVKKLMEMLG